MFTPARYVIVDDDADELNLLTTALQEMGAPCLPIRYDQAFGIDERKLCGVRLLFLDLHLTTGAQTNDVASAAAIIVGMLEAGITATSGPYVIILWTKHENQRDEFDAYVMDNLEPSKRPFAILGLDKNPYLTGGSGQRLAEDIERVVETDPRLRALFNWEREVLRAAGTTISEIGSLVAEQDRRAPRFSERLDEILSLLAREAVGIDGAKRDPFSAVNSVLMPMLSDRIANQRTNPLSDEIWKAAVTKVDAAAAPELAASAKLNAMLHVALPDGEAMSSASWGSLTLLPEEGAADFIRKRFNLEARSLYAGPFCVQTRADRRKCRLAILRVGASCDHAQGRRGPIPFVLGAVMPAAALRRDDVPKAEFLTPPLLLPGFEEPVVVAFNTHFQISMVPDDLVDLSPSCRFREQLLMQITAHGANNATRPAIVRFAPKTE